MVFFLLTTHTDYKVEELLQENLAWMKETFTTVLAECVPKNLRDKEVLVYLENIYSTCTIDFDKFASHLPKSIEIGILQERPKLDVSGDAERITIGKAKVLNEILRISDKIGIQIPVKLILNFKRYSFFRLCLENGLSIVGAEPIDYKSGNTDLHTRNIAMIETIEQEERSGKSVFFNVGAAHGIELAERLCASSTMPHSFIRLSMQTNMLLQSRFSNWVSENPSLDLGYGNTLNLLEIPSHYSLTEQSRLLQSGYKIYSGTRGFPKMMEHDIYSGTKQIVHPNPIPLTAL